MGLLRKTCRKNLLFALLSWQLTVEAKAELDEEQWLMALRSEAGRLRFSSYSMNLGQVNQGDELEFRFPFHEEGVGAVKIIGVHVDCGCLALSVKPGQLVPIGSQSELIVRMDTRHFNGILDKELIILTNETRERPHFFRLKAKIDRLIVVNPPLVELDLSKANQAEPVRVSIQSLSKQTLHIEKLKYNEDTLEVQSFPLGDAWELQIRWIGPSTLARVDELIEIVAESPAMRLKIPVVGRLGESRFNAVSKP